MAAAMSAVPSDDTAFTSALPVAPASAADRHSRCVRYGWPPVQDKTRESREVPRSPRPWASGAASAAVKSWTSMRLPMLKGVVRVSATRSAGVAVPSRQKQRRCSRGFSARPT